MKRTVLLMLVLGRARSLSGVKLARAALR